MKAKILLIDDDQEITEVTKLILEESGYVVETGQSEKDLRTALSRQNPDMIIMDIWLGHANGNQLARMIKKNPRTKNIPIILFSALALTDSVVRFADGFLRKPYDMDVLLRLVDHHLHKKYPAYAELNQRS